MWLERQWERSSQLNIQERISMWAHPAFMLEAGWEATYCELFWLKWWVTPSWWRTSTRRLSPSNISLALLKHGNPTVPTPLLDTLSCLPTYHQFWCLLGAPGNRYNPEIQQQIISEKSNLIFFQDRGKVASVRSLTSCRLSMRLLSQKQEQE